MRLNEQTIRKIQPPAKGYQIHRDDEIKGLGLRCTAAGARSFVFGYTTGGGVERRLTIGPWPEWSTTAAREHAKKLRVRVDRGEDPQQDKDDRREAPTVDYIIQEYLARHAAKKKSGHIDRQYLERNVAPAWGKWKAADVQKRHVIEMVERKAQTAPIAANMLLSIIKGLFAWAIKKDLLKDSDGRDISNPAARVDPPAEKVERDRWLTEAEIRTVWEKIDSAKMVPACRAALRLILILGQRPGEVVGAEWSEMDLDTALWTIPKEKAKAGIQHGVPLTTMALEQLEPLERGCWVLPGFYGGASGHLTVGGLARAVSENREHFGIPRWTPHDLRRTCATHLAKAGVERFIIARVLGHADKTITATYERHSYDAEKRKALQVWERRLRDILSGKAAGRVVSIG